MKVVGIIPSHLNSLRFPRKILYKIKDLPMIEHVRRRALISKQFDEVIVCTCDLQIKKVINSYKGKVILTSRKHKNGTSRVTEAIKKVKASHVVIIQGDEPLIDPKHIDKVIEWHSKNMNFEIVVPSLKSKNIDTPHIVKIAKSKNKVIYFSRSLVPNPFNKQNKYFLKHLSVISFLPSSLKKFRTLKQGALEKIEGIELMRALENNMSIGTFNLVGSSFSVDTKDDFLKAIKFMNIDKIRNKY